MGGMVFSFASIDIAAADGGEGVGPQNAALPHAGVKSRVAFSGSLIGIACCFFVAIAAGQSHPPTCSHCEEWNQPQAPFRVFGNTYYVGTHGLSSLLIISPDGHILIDGDLPESVDQIVSHIHSLGFRIEDVKIIVNSHVHFDHAGGIARLQRLSGARVLASAWSAAVLKSGGVGKDDPQNGVIVPIAGVQNVQELRGEESFTAGEVVMTMHLTGGHTRGGQVGPGSPVKARFAIRWCTRTV